MTYNPNDPFALVGIEELASVPASPAMHRGGHTPGFDQEQSVAAMHRVGRTPDHARNEGLSGTSRGDLDAPVWVPPLQSGLGYDPSIQGEAPPASTGQDYLPGRPPASGLTGEQGELQ